MNFLFSLLVLINSAGPSQSFLTRPPSPDLEQSPLLIFGKRDTIRVAYHPDHRILYEGRGWRIVMVDPETVALTFIANGAKIDYPKNVRRWEVKKKNSGKLRVSLSYLGVFDLHGEAHLLVRDPIRGKRQRDERIECAGDADVRVFLNTIFHTPHCLIQTNPPYPHGGSGSSFSVRDFHASDTPCIARDPRYIQYRSKVHRQQGYSSATKEALYARLSVFEKDDVVNDCIWAGRMTAPQLLREICNWNGLDGFRLDPIIDTAESGGLLCGWMDRGLPLDKVLDVLEGTWFHYEMTNNKLYVTALPAYLPGKEADRKRTDSLKRARAMSQKRQ